MTRILNRTAVNTIIRECLTEKGAGNYIFLPPFIAVLIHEKVEKKALELELKVKDLITDRVIAAAFKAHTADQKKKLAQPEEKTSELL